MNSYKILKPAGIPMSTAGRLEIANTLLKMGIIKTPEQYIEILEGNLKVWQRQKNNRKIKKRLGIK